MRLKSLKYRELRAYEFSKEIINEMELNWYIKKYHKRIYYYLI